MKFRLLIISKFSSFKALQRKLDDPNDSDEDAAEYLPQDDKPKWYIIEATSRNKLFWNMFTNIFYMISFFTFPYCIGFDFEPMNRMQIFELLVDSIMVCDIITEFITTKEKDGKKFIRFQEIAFFYMKATFIFDVAACLPGLITLEKHK